MRVTIRHLAALAAIGIAAACSEPTAGPRASQSPISPTGPAFDYSAAGQFGLGANDFVVTPSGGSYTVGGLFNVTFPANSVCDPSLSNYAAAQWDAPCATLQRAISVHASIQLGTSGLAVNFTPELRFSPSANVTISTGIFAPTIRANRNFFASNPSALGPLALYYIQTLGATPQADYVADPSVVTHVNLTSGLVWRRIKHFSGYSQTAGHSCTPAADATDCVVVDAAAPQ